MEGDDILAELDEVELPTKLRGYDPFEVDQILERARAEIVDLRSRAQIADNQVRATEERVELEMEAIRQTQAEAAGALAAAREEGERLVAEARTEANRLVAASETEVREAIESGREQLLGELMVLESRRNEARDVIELAEHQMAAHRDRLLSAIEDLRTLVEGLTIAQELGDQPPTVKAQVQPQGMIGTDLGEFPAASADTVGSIRRIGTLASAAEAAGSEDFGVRIPEFRRSHGESDADTVAPEGFLMDKGDGRSRTGRH